MTKRFSRPPSPRCRELLPAALSVAVVLGAGISVAQQPAWPAISPPAPGTAKTFAETCAGCHGAEGGRAPNLLDERFLAGRSDEDLHRTIQGGVPSAGMPAFRDILSEAQIWQMVSYLRLQSAALKGPPSFVPDPNNQIIKSRKQTFRVEVVARGLQTPWGLTFLPDGRLLLTERAGRLRFIVNGKLSPQAVKGTPAVWERQDSGMLDVALHPDYRRNGWIYLSYTDVAPGYVAPPAAAADVDPGARPPSPPSMTVIIRGKINARNEWVQSQEIFRAPAALYTSSGAHYGSRFAFDRQGHVFFSIGDRGDMTTAQDLANPLGKIHRVNDDGSVPTDNPFVNTPGAIPSIWTYGHRNPEGLAWDPVTGLLWESEHGPFGGDEINIVEKGKNYGWGVISMGVQAGITKRSQPGMEQPVAYYTPTIAPSGIAFYAGDRYPGWKNNLFVAGLAGQQLRRLEVKGRQVVTQEVVFDQFGRTRAVATGPDGLLYALIQTPTGGATGVGITAPAPGMVIRLVPVK